MRPCANTQNSPVGLKEAALDSPTFRAAFTHFSEQLDLAERWLDNYVRSISKLSHEVGPLESLVNGFFTQSALPLNVSEAVIDHDYTLLAMKRYGEGAREYWSTTIASLKKMEANMVEPIRLFLLNDLRVFKVRQPLSIVVALFISTLGCSDSHPDAGDSSPI